MSSRIHHPGLRSKVMSAAEAAAFIQHGTTVGMSGFTGSGYPKAVPMALAERAVAAAGHGPDLGTGEGVALLDGAVRQSGEGLAHRRVHEARIRGGAGPEGRALFAVVDHAGRAR